MLALGGWLKNTVCATRGDEAVLSQHVGALDNTATLAFLDEGDPPPAARAATSRRCWWRTTCIRILQHALAGFAAEHDLPVLAVQHHHAHVAAVLAEHGVTDAGARRWCWTASAAAPTAAPGAASCCGWTARRCDASATGPLPLPGGDRAAREPWRMAAAALMRSAAARKSCRALRPARRDGRAHAGRAAEVPADQILRPLVRRGRRPAGGARHQQLRRPGGRCCWKALAGRHGPRRPLPRLDASAPTACWTCCRCWPPGRLNDAADGAALFHATLAAALVGWACTRPERRGIDTWHWVAVVSSIGCWPQVCVAALDARGLTRAARRGRCRPTTAGSAWARPGCGGRMTTSRRY